MTANSERDVINSLSGQSLFPVKVSTEKAASGEGFSFGKAINDQKLAVFYEQLASLMSNGVPMLRSLTILRDQTQIPKFEAALTDVISRVEDGETLSDSFARHPRIFSEMAINMSRAGAEGGFLEDALTRVGIFTEQQAELKSRTCLLYTSPSPRDQRGSRMPSSA